MIMASDRVNLKTKINFLVLSLLVGLLLLPLFAQATGGAVENGLIASKFMGIFPTSGVGGSRNLTELIYNAVRILLTFAGAIAVVFVVVGGFWYLTSGGNEEQAEKGKRTLINAIIGIIVVVLSYAIVNVIVNLVSYGQGIFG